MLKSSLGFHDSTGILAPGSTHTGLSNCSSPGKSISDHYCFEVPGSPACSPFIRPLCHVGECNPSPETHLSSQMSPYFPNVLSNLGMMKSFIPKLAKCNNHSEFFQLFAFSWNKQRSSRSSISSLCLTYHSPTTYQRHLAQQRIHNVLMF